MQVKRDGEVLEMPTPMPKVQKLTRRDILDRAAACVCGEREEDYGSPEDSFGLIAELWTSYLKRKCVGGGADVCVDAADVAMLMALLKVARVAGGRGTADCFVDLAGYAACGGEVAGV